MLKHTFIASLALALWTPHLSNGEILKVASFYGKYTAMDDIYKQIMTDASTYINDDRGGQQIVPSGDQVNVIHQNLLNNRNFDDQTLSKAVYQVCNDLRSTGASVVIMPNDFCDNCDDIGGVLGEAYSPVFTLDQADGSGAFKMRPNLDDMEEMITDVIAHFKWSTFMFLYQGDVAFGLVEAMTAKALNYGWTITPIEVEDDFEKQAEDLKRRRVKNILIFFTNEDILGNIVNIAFDTQLLSNGYHWVFGNLNPPISKSFLEQYYRHNMAFLTRFKVVANELLYYTSLEKPVKNWRFRQRAAYDALVAATMAMKLHNQREGRYPAAVPVCGSTQKSTLEPYIKQISFRGASGDVAFNEHGDRVNYTINIFSGKDKFAQNLAGHFVQDVKSWEIANGEKWPGKPGKRTYIKPFRQSDARFIRILAVPEPPFFMEKDWERVRYSETENFDDEPIDENAEDYQGYSWELLKEVKKVFEEEMGIPFDFQITLMSPGQYGSLDLSTGEWDGMIRELIDGDADVAIGSLTKNGARENDIDFTDTWYKSQLKVAILHPSWTFEYPFSLVYPYHITAWFALLAIVIVIALGVFCLGRFSPYEYRSLAARGQATEEEAETFSFFDSIWYVLSAGFWQSYTRGPRSWSLRILSSFWFYFALCMIFLYVENLNSVFKFSKTAIKIKDVHDLLYNDVIEFGAVRRSPSYDFYRYNRGQYRMVFDRILNSEKNLLEEKITNAIYRIRRQWDGRYAVLGEERILKYAAARKPCRIYISGRTLGKISFSFATPSGSPLRDQLSHAIKTLKKRGNISRILEMEFSNRLHCAEDTLFETETKKSFTIHDFQGLYYLMFIGLGGSVIVFILEWLFFVLFVDKSSRPRIGTKRTARPKANDLQTDFYGSGPGQSAAAEKAPTDWI